MNSENIMLNEKSQVQKTHTLYFHLYEMSSIGKFIEIKSRFLVARSWEKGDMDSDYGYRVSFMDDEMF